MFGALPAIVRGGFVLLLTQFMYNYRGPHMTLIYFHLFSRLCHQLQPEYILFRICESTARL
jgi:hypothetical protein